MFLIYDNANIRNNCSLVTIIVVPIIGLGANLALLYPVEMASTIVILGMIGYFTGVVQTPITAFVIVMEMTDNHELVLAMMATALISSAVSKLVCKKSIYEALAENLLAMMSDEKSRQKSARN